MNRRIGKGMGALAVAAVLALSGCGEAAEPAFPAEAETEEEQLRASVTQELESIKALNQGAVGALTETPVVSQEDYTVDPKALIQAAVGDFDYQVEQLSLNEAEDAAEVTITFTTKPLGETLVNWLNAQRKDKAQLSTLSALPKETLGRTLRLELLEALHAAPAVETTAVLPWAYIDGTWTLTPAGQETLTAVFLGEAA